ncbi:hypothetical protein WP1_248 [Pseudomonas phage WP1]
MLGIFTSLLSSRSFSTVDQNTNQLSCYGPEDKPGQHPVFFL